MMYLFIVCQIGVRGICEIHAMLENRICDYCGVTVAWAPILYTSPCSSLSCACLSYDISRICILV